MSFLVGAAVGIGVAAIAAAGALIVIAERSEVEIDKVPPIR